MAEEAQVSKTKDPAVFFDSSLEVLATEIASSGSLLEFYMLLNIPTTTIVYYCNEVSDVGIKHADAKQLLGLSKNLAEYWKVIRSEGRNKDKATDIERALRGIGKPEAADGFKERFNSNAEMTSDMFMT